MKSLIGIIIKSVMVSSFLTWCMRCCEKQDMLANAHLSDGVYYYYNGIEYYPMTTGWTISIFIFFGVIFFFIIGVFSDPTK